MKEVIKTAERKSISKKMRFEVFKKDKFTCQYCGRMAPDVVLEVDHITPVAEGGDNDILNLVTACKDCNRGKGKRILSDDVVVKKQQNLLKELAEKNEQLEMMVKWKDEMLKLDERIIDAVCAYIQDAYSVELTEHGRNQVKLWLKKYSFEELIAATDMAFEREQFDTERALKAIPKCAYYAKHPISEEKKQIFYLRKILINRLKYADETRAYTLIDNALNKHNIPFEDVKRICRTCRSWTSFVTSLEEDVE